jgi:hypothetical protein
MSDSDVPGRDPGVASLIHVPELRLLACRKVSGPPRGPAFWSASAICFGKKRTLTKSRQGLRSVYPRKDGSPFPCTLNAMTYPVP